MSVENVKGSQPSLLSCLLQRILIHMDKVHSPHGHYSSHAKGCKELTRGEQFRVRGEGWR